DPVNEKSAIVRARSAEALGKIASNKFSAAALGRYGVTGIADSLARLLPSPSAPLDDDSKLIASMTLTALLRVREPSTVDAVAEQLHSNDPEIRWQAANALARIRERINAAVPALIPLLRDSDPLVRAHSARALGVAKAGQAVESLVALLSDKD